MPGPGPHMMYAMGTGLAMTKLSNDRFSPHHTLTYTINSFFGPDIGSFSEWLGSFFDYSFGSSLADAIHHPFYYFIILGFPLCVLYSWLSRFVLLKGLLDSASGVPLTRWQCFLLICAGFMFSFGTYLVNMVIKIEILHKIGKGLKFITPEIVTQIENGQSSMNIWILSTGWWKDRAPINPDAVVVVAILCTCLSGGFLFIHSVKPAKAARNQSYHSAILILIIASLYCLWCFSQIFWVNPRRAAVGEEADLGVLVFLATYFFLPHCLCIMSMRDPDTEALPLITV